MYFKIKIYNSDSNFDKKLSPVSIFENKQLSEQLYYLKKTALALTKPGAPKHKIVFSINGITTSATIYSRNLESAHQTNEIHILEDENTNSKNESIILKKIAHDLLVQGAIRVKLKVSLHDSSLMLSARPMPTKSEVYTKGNRKIFWSQPKQIQSASAQRVNNHNVHKISW